MSNEKKYIITTSLQTGQKLFVYEDTHGRLTAFDDNFDPLTREEATKFSLAEATRHANGLRNSQPREMGAVVAIELYDPSPLVGMLLEKMEGTHPALLAYMGQRLADGLTIPQLAEEMKIALDGLVK